MSIFIIAIVLGIISSCIFYGVNYYIFSVIGKIFFVGSEIELSYNMFIYTGLITLCGVIIACTYIIFKKIDKVAKKG